MSSLAQSPPRVAHSNLAGAPAPHIALAPDHSTNRSAPPQRYHALDALRALAMLLGIVLHAAIAYMPARMPHLLWAIHDRQTTPWLSWLFWGLHAFRLPLFFVIAGFFSALLYEKHGGNAYLVHRTRRVLWPLLGGGVVLLPIVLAIWCAGWLISGESTLGQVVRLKFRWDLQEGVYGLGHLWFLEHLFLMCLGFWAWRRWTPPAALLAGVAERVWRSRYAPLWLALPGALVVYLWPAAVLDFDQPFLPQPARLLYYLTFFIAGVSLYGQRERLIELTQGYRLQLLLAVPVMASLGLLVPLAASGAPAPAARMVLAIDHALLAWLVSLGLMGLFLRLLNRPLPMVRYLSDASYYIYLVHMPLVAVVQIGLYRLDWPPTVKFMLSAAVPAALCLASYHDLVRGTWIGEFLTGRRETVSAASRQRARAYAAIPAVMAAGALSFIGDARQLCFDHNLQYVIPGVIFRSAMLKPRVTAETIDRLALRSVVSLQHADDSLPWFVAQKQECFSRRVALYVVDLPEDALPSREALESLMATIDSAPRPILLEGRFGFGRTALAGAIARLLAGQSTEEAHREFALATGVCDRTPASPQNVLRAYEAWLQANAFTHTPDQFRNWVSHHYRPWAVELAARSNGSLVTAR